MNLNTVLAAISWAQLEPSEGKFDYTLVDGLIRDARTSGLRLVLLWFGSRKNTYIPPGPLGEFQTTMGNGNFPVCVFQELSILR
jgi:beta-galactosidase GanA